MSTAQEYIAPKTILPTSLDSAGYQAVMGTQILERSFVMACVTEAKYLTENKKLIEDITSGVISPAEARNKLKQFYDQQGYQAPIGKEGTIKDLASERRMQATIDTNVAMARGYQRKAAMVANKSRPAAELVRIGHAMAPRDWQSRWAEAYAKVGGAGALKSPMIALHSSPIWVALSRFGTSYPPYDWGSHMNIKPVSLRRCHELGLIAKGESAPIAEMKSFNADQGISTKGIDSGIKEQLASKLQGCGKMTARGIKLTDTDGTSPCEAGELEESLRATYAAGHTSQQAAAAAKWMDSPDNLNHEEAAHLKNVLTRLKKHSSKSGEPVMRGLGFASQDEGSQFIEQVKTKGYAAQSGKAAEAWTSEKSRAEAAPKTAAKVVLIADSYHSCRSVGLLYQTLADLRLSKAIDAPESERVFLASSHFGYKSHHVDEMSGIVYLSVKELRENNQND